MPMTLKELKERAAEFGAQARTVEEESNDRYKRRLAQEGWEAFKESFKDHPKRMDIIRVYTKAYIGDQ